VAEPSRVGGRAEPSRWPSRAESVAEPSRWPSRAESVAEPGREPRPGEEDGAGTRIGGRAGAGSRGSGPEPVTVPGLPSGIRSRAVLRAGPEPNRAEPSRAATEPGLTGLRRSQAGAETIADRSQTTLDPVKSLASEGE
jgi:hypothetical protein